MLSNFVPISNVLSQKFCAHLRLNLDDFKQYKEPLEDFLGLRPDLEKGMVDEDIILQRMQRALPSFAFAPAISFERLKEPGRLAEKIATEDRDTFDIYGKQLWLADPKMIERMIALENPQHPLRVRWRERGVEVKIDNHFAAPKAHGYRGIHMNFNLSGNKNWREGMEIQILPVGLMQVYLLTRAPYETYRALEEHIKRTKGKNELNWTEEERGIIYPPREYICSLYEAETYKMDLIKLMSRNGGQTLNGNAQEAEVRVASLRWEVDAIVSNFIAYDRDAEAVIENAREILKDIRRQKGAKLCELQQATGTDNHGTVVPLYK